MKQNKLIVYAIKGLIIVGFFLFFSTLAFNPVLAEDKSAPGGIIPKLQKTPNDPELFGGHVYPEWGPVCQRYTYSVVYRDKENREPEYVKIYFNGRMIDMTKADPNDNNYQKGIRYEYKFVPDKIGSNFYYFEASNGLGKARDSIIDSPDNGPVLFGSAFDKNEVVLIDPANGSIVWRFSTGKEWVGGVALSADSQYLAALTSKYVYLFSTSSDKPLWQYEFGGSSPIGGGPRGNGIAISADGNQIFAAAGMEVVSFDKSNNQPLWKYQSPALAVAISKDGQYLAATVVKEGKNAVLLWETKSNQPIREFTADSNFHDVSLSADGSYTAASTGCPDRKAYIFSKDSSQPLVKSERLTFDSPVSKSKISADGSLAAFATEGGPDSSVVVLFSKDSSIPLWKFDNQKRNSSRAMSMTTDGQFIAAATMMGDIYLLSSKNNTPLKTWSLNTSVGALDIADDGSLIAVGGTDNQVQILSVTSDQKKISVNEFVQTIDIADNGKYLAAGTGGSVYFFEDYLTPNKDKVFECTTVIEPSPQEQVRMNYFQGSEGMPIQNPPMHLQPKNLVPLLKESFVLAGILTLFYFLIVYFQERLSLTHPATALITLPLAIMLWKINNFRFNFQPITDFCASAFSFWTILVLVGLKLKIPKIFYLVGSLYLAILGTITLTIYQPFFSFPTVVHLIEAVLGFGYLSSFFKNKKRVLFLGLVVIILVSAHLLYQGKGFLFLAKGPAKDIIPHEQQHEQQEEISAPSGGAVCGNNLCEPDFGESKETCPQDCSAGD